MVIHNSQTEFRLLVTIVHTRDFENVLICAQITRLYCVRKINNYLKVWKDKPMDN